MTAPGNDRSIGQLVADAVDDVRAIVAHEKALAKAELSRAAKAGGAGAALVVAAVTTFGLAVVYLLIAAAEALIAAGMSRWAGFLVVGGALVVLALLLGLVGALSLKKVRGPERAVEQGRGAVEDVRSALSGPDDEGLVPDAATQTARTTATTVIGTRGAGDRD
jgi:hypothetical protein